MNKRKHILLLGCHDSSVDSSAPSILTPQVRVPSTPSTLLPIYIDFYHVEKTNINKKWPGLAHFLKQQTTFFEIANLGN